MNHERKVLGFGCMNLMFLDLLGLAKCCSNEYFSIHFGCMLYCTSSSPLLKVEVKKQTVKHIGLRGSPSHDRIALMKIVGSELGGLGGNALEDV